MKNIVLIGMPSCGKSTIGAIISQKTNRKLIDTDREIELSTGISIPEIFARDGENGFRIIEKEIIKTVSKNEGAIISCGGGAVLNGENVKTLKENGIVVLIKRDVNLLSTEGRPLSKSLTVLKEMEKIRMPIYEKCADFAVTNDKTPEETAEIIIREVLYENNDI